jgi:hypothetical protein
MPGPPGKRVREAVAEVERGPMPSLAVSPPPAHRASREILIDSDDVDLRIAEKPERVHVAAYGQRQSTYAQLRSWIAACHPRGTFRGTVFWPIPTQRVPSVRSTVLSVQLARVLHEAILLVNGRSAVRSRSPAPSSEGVSALCVSRFVERMLLAGLSGSVPAAVTDGGGGVDQAPKSHRAPRMPTSFGLIPCQCRSGS